MDRSDAAARLQRDEVLAWVGSSTASRQATRELARLGTPDPAVAGDELVQVVAVRVLARLDDGPIHASADGTLAAYLTRALRNAAIDVYRSARARDAHELLGPRVDDAPEPSDPPAPPPTEVDAIADELRAHLAATAPLGEPWQLSGALTFVVVAAEPGLLASVRHPLPENRPDEAPVWAALGYAGLDGDLPGPGRPDDAARRKRRSRHGTKVRELLAAAGSRWREEAR